MLSPVVTGFRTLPPRIDEWYKQMFGLNKLHSKQLSEHDAASLSWSQLLWTSHTFDRKVDVHEACFG